MEFLDYAADNWTAHYRQAQHLSDESLQNLAYQLCQLRQLACRVWLWLFAENHPEASIFSREEAHPILLAGDFGFEVMLRPIFATVSSSFEKRALSDGRTALS